MNNIKEPQNNDNTYKSLSHKVHQNVSRTVQNVSSSFDKFKIENDDDIIYLCNAINHFYRDLSNSIFDLQNITIKIGRTTPTGASLMSVVDGLNNEAHLVQKCFDFKPPEIITKLKKIILNVERNAEKLMEVVKEAELNKHRQRLLDIQHDLLIAIGMLQMFNECRHAKLSEVEQMWINAVKKLKTTLEQIRSAKKLSAKQFVHCVQHSLQHLQNYKDIMHKVKNNENFSPELKSALQIVDSYSVNYLNSISAAVETEKPLDDFIAVLEGCQNMYQMAAQQMYQLHETVCNAKSDQHEIGKVKDLLIFLFVATTNNMKLLDLCVYDAALTV